MNAVYAFLQGSEALSPLNSQFSLLKVDGSAIDQSQATAAIGYVKTNVPAESKTLTIEKSTEGTSWGAVYAQFMQPTKSVEAAASGLTVTRELLTKGELKVGDRIKVRITITSCGLYGTCPPVERLYTGCLLYPEGLLHELLHRYALQGKARYRDRILHRPYRHLRDWPLYRQLCLCT